MIDEPLLLHLTVKLCNYAIITLKIKGTYVISAAYKYPFLRPLVSDNLKESSDIGPKA